MSYGRVYESDWRGSSLLNPSSNGGGGGYRSFAGDDFGASRSSQPLGGGGGVGGGVSSNTEFKIHDLQLAVAHLEKDNDLVKNAITILEGDRNNLRQAIRKLKVENSRMKQKLKRVAGSVKGADGMDLDDEDEIDYADIRDFILVGGPKDPFSLRYEASIRDVQGLEHKSAERYLWYKMAETFGDLEAAEKIRTADNGAKAEEEMGKIKKFDENTWNTVKMKHWDDGQRLKVEQIRWIGNLLVHSDPTYIAVASQDKTWGTGWRKQRQESAQPRMWDGENQGGKALMKLRTEMKPAHSFTGPNEKEETEKKFQELKRTFWRREMPRDGGMGGGMGRGGMGMGGGRGGMGGGGGGGYPSKRPRRGGAY